MLLYFLVRLILISDPMIRTALLSLAAGGTQYVLQSNNWLPFVGTIIGAMITSSIAYLSYRRTKAADNKQHKLQENLSVLQGFSELTERLQAQVERLEADVDECNRDRRDLHTQVAVLKAEVNMLKATTIDGRSTS